ncbi:GDYXXLXY domain-containing protein [bacterium]|nr:GDYXXLXY domain-containing protein [bacterium]
MKKAVYIIIAVWFLIVAVWTIKSEIILRKGTEVLLKTVPVDPRDLFMGDYVILNYEIGQYNNNRRKNLKYGDKVYVILNKDKNNMVSIEDVTSIKPYNKLFLEGKMSMCDTIIPLFKNGRCIKYGIESYYVKEGKGRELERKLQNGAYVKVSITKDGKAKVKGFVE